MAALGLWIPFEIRAGSHYTANYAEIDLEDLTDPAHDLFASDSDRNPNPVQRKPSAPAAEDSAAVAAKRPPPTVVVASTAAVGADESWMAHSCE